MRLLWKERLNSGRKKLCRLRGTEPLPFCGNADGYYFELPSIDRFDNGLRRSDRNFVLALSSTEDHADAQLLSHSFWSTFTELFCPTPRESVPHQAPRSCCSRPTRY